MITKFVPELVTIKNRCGLEVQKPSTIVEYNGSKTFIDLSDQCSSYNSPHHRSIKWYRKTVFELLLNTCVVNAHMLYKLTTGKDNYYYSFQRETCGFTVP